MLVVDDHFNNPRVLTFFWLELLESPSVRPSLPIDTARKVN